MTGELSGTLSTWVGVNRMYQDGWDESDEIDLTHAGVNGKLSLG